jgi:hypothetical protein
MENEGLSTMVKKTGISPRYLWKRARDVNPKLQTVIITKKMEVKPNPKSKAKPNAERFTQEVKDERFRLAKKYMQRGIKLRMCDTFIDEGAIMIGKVPTLRAITGEGKKLTSNRGRSSISLPRAMQMESLKFPKEACGKLSFIIAVHPAIGLVYFDLLSPTTNHPKHGHYKSGRHISKGITSKEFDKSMEKILAKLRRLSMRHSKYFLKGPKVVLDPVTFHVPKIKSLSKRVLEIPKKSPEFTKPVKRVINAIKTEFWKRYAEMLQKPGPDGYISLKRAKLLLRRVVKDVVMAENISKDVHSMYKVYKAVADAKGA